jgi:PKD repeat protein
VYQQTGEYLVTLTLTDGKGGWSELSRIVTVETASPPFADFSVIMRSPDRVPRVGRPIRFQDESSDPGGEIVSWRWEFGDGRTAFEPSPIHSYERHGEYIVRLQVVDTQGETAVQSRSLAVASLAPVAEFTRSPDRPNSGESVRFDAAASRDPDGAIATYLWDFDGDGTFDDTTPDPILERTFAPGEVEVQLTVVDDAGDTSAIHADTFIVNASPIAEFRLSTFEAYESEAIRFTDLSHDEDGMIIARLWMFGDGTSAIEPNPEHAFDEDGTHAVSLTVTDDRGAARTTTAEVTIANLPPTAVISTETTERLTGEAYPLDASGSSDPSPSGSIAQYEWDLDGDGVYDRTTTEPTLSHAFDNDGMYTVRLRVTDDDGASAVSDPLTVRVANRPPRVHRITWTPQSPNDTEEVLLASTASDDDGELVRWHWDFDDGVIVTGSGPTVRFPGSGTFAVRVSVEDDDGARSDLFSAEIAIDNMPPIAEFSAASIGGLCVRFDAHASIDPSPAGVIRHIAWSFGDGSSCPGDADGCGDGDRWSPVHCYDAPGAYAVTLAVVDDQGALTRTAKTIHVAE